MKAEWKGRVAFAEVAEAIGCETGDVLAMSPTNQIVMWTTETESDDPRLWAAGLRRDERGILRLATDPREIGGGLRELLDGLDEALARLDEETP